MLVRFAGPRLENGGDDLLPVPLRVGGRTLGGALSWSTPQKLAAIEDDSLFAGTPVSPEVTVSRQVLADPAMLGPEVNVWARLQDGTPLVTERKLGDGQIILFHVTANSDWSNLPLSGLFVEMLRRISALSTERWQDHFGSVANDAILVKVDDRVLHYWGSDGFYRIYPTSVPLTEEMTRRGRTSVTLKRPDPDWRPTPAMLKRNPDLPGYVPPGPDNPLGIRALNLGWPSYRIHGTNDIRKIGRQSSSGCIGLFNEHILEVYGRAQIGTPVLLI